MAYIIDGMPDVADPNQSYPCRVLWVCADYIEEGYTDTPPDAVEHAARPIVQRGKESAIIKSILDDAFGVIL